MLAWTMASPRRGRPSDTTSISRTRQHGSILIVIVILHVLGIFFLHPPSVEEQSLATSLTLPFNVTRTISNEPSTNKKQLTPNTSQWLRNTTSRNQRHSKFAYAFLISGCDPSKPLTYRPYLWNVLVATKILRDNGSHQDVVLLIQMARGATNSTLLPVDRLRLDWMARYAPNQNSTLHVYYLPPLIRDNFYNAQLEKFRILELTHYQRILYLDADVLPLCNLDYLFHLSISGALQPNVVLAWFTEPSHGGFFLLEPGRYDQWQHIVQRHEQQALQLPYPHWDPVQGWGHALSEEWRGIPQPILLPNGTTTFIEARHSTNWTFHGDFADQGLLYYWTRFHRQAVSIVSLDDLQHVTSNQTWFQPTSQLLGPHTCLPKGMEYPGHYGSSLASPLFHQRVPHRDFCHFSGDGKPWQAGHDAFPTRWSDLRSSTDYWYYVLGQIYQALAQEYPQHNLPALPLKHQPPVLGKYPTHRSRIGTIRKKLRKKQMENDNP